MFAVIKTGGKQYKVASGDVIRVEKIAGDAGAEVEFAEVLMIGGAGGATMGKPLVSGAAVRATVVDQTRGPKILVFKKKRRQNYRRRKGHRQDLTVVRIADILPPGAERKPLKAAPEKPKEAKAKEAKPAAKAAKEPAKKTAAKPAKAKAPARAKAAAKPKSSAKGKTGKEKK